jgi:glycosyltransferase involved in cell wall biosynthesis
MQDLKKIKVCHFASVHVIQDTRVFHRECVSLAEHFDVTYIGIGHSPDELEGVKLIPIPKPKSRITRILFTTWKVFFKAWRLDADIYHIHDAELIPLASLLHLLKGKPVIYDIHENTYEDILRKPWVPKLLKHGLGLGYRFLEWISSKTMNTILVIAKPEFATKFLASKNKTIIQNFADIKHLQKFQVTERGSLKGNHIFYMGTIFDYYYNIYPVLEAIDVLNKQSTPTHFHFIGYIDPVIKSRIFNSESYKKVQNQVTFYDHMDMNDGYEISRKCKIGLCLKNQDESILVSHERKFFEYLAVGLPIVCCNSAIYYDIVEKEQIGKSVDISRADKIAEAIKQMLENGDMLNTYAQNGITAANQTYNWENEKEKLLEFYKQNLKL